MHIISIFRGGLKTSNLISLSLKFHPLRQTDKCSVPYGYCLLALAWLGVLPDPNFWPASVVVYAVPSAANKRLAVSQHFPAFLYFFSRHIKWEWKPKEEGQITLPIIHSRCKLVFGSLFPNSLSSSPPSRVFFFRFLSPFSFAFYFSLYLWRFYLLLSCHFTSSPLTSFVFHSLLFSHSFSFDFSLFFPLLLLSFHSTLFSFHFLLPSLLFLSRFRPFPFGYFFPFTHYTFALTFALFISFLSSSLPLFISFLSSSLFVSFLWSSLYLFIFSHLLLPVLYLFSFIFSFSLYFASFIFSLPLFISFLSSSLFLSLYLFFHFLARSLYLFF